MTVSSLWKALDSVGCAKPVAAAQLANGALGKPQTLAVDLSIWICESLTAYGINETNANPSLHLVFARTMKLLKLGLNLIFVVEGKKRVRDDASNELNTFRRRRSGTIFWKACNECQHMLEMLGVPVVRATCEGEALCALLCDRGIVDGVLSNDSDCLLFGAKVVYTKFSNENLDNGRVMRYDLNSLYANVDASDDPDINATKVSTIKLSRADLIAFALLTGSDLAGSGLEKVGYKKAIRFIRKCQLDNPLSKETATLDEMKAWAKAARANVPQNTQVAKTTEKCCSRCTHHGSKRSHEKHGCVQCGTGPGELCYLVTSEDHFRKSLREKALAMVPKFDPSHVRSTYMRPNDNQLPLRLLGAVPHSIQMEPPNLCALLQSSIIVKGRSLMESRQYVRQAIARLLSSRELHRVSCRDNIQLSSHPQGARDRPIPRAIVRELTKNQEPCYEVMWLMSATVSDDNGDGIDGFEYQTVESQKLIEQTYPHLIDSFRNQKAESVKQGDAMQRKRREFLELIRNGEQIANDHVGEANKKRKGRFERQRDDFFQNQGPRVTSFDMSSRRRRRSAQQRGVGGDDIGNLLRFACPQFPSSPCKVITKPNHSDDLDRGVQTGDQSFTSFDEPPTPNAESIFCTMGGYAIEITPMASHRGVYPPKHIFVHLDSNDTT